MGFDEFDLDVRISAFAAGPARPIRPVQTRGPTCADTCGNTCADTCLYTCAETCQTCQTCGATCANTCGATCNCGVTKDECNPTGNQYTCAETCSGQCNTQQTCLNNCNTQQDNCGGLTETAIAGPCCV